MDDAARRATQEVEAAIVHWRSQDDGALSYNVLRDLIINRFATALRELEAELDHFYNLLAVIHRDGGHYQAEHGSKKAGADAEAIVLGERTRLARVEGAAARAYGECEGAFHQSGSWGALSNEAVEMLRVALTPDATTEKRCPSCKRSYTRIVFSEGAGWVCNNCEPKTPDAKTCSAYSPLSEHEPCKRPYGHSGYHQGHGAKWW